MESPVKGEIKAEVDARSVDKLVDAIVDTFSPVSEGLGWVGDAIRLARVDVAAKITRRAGEIAQEHGLKLSAPPLKFLVPFYEKASTEDAGDETLMEMWARLLASAGNHFGSRYLRYPSLLSEMSRGQAEILDGMIRINRRARLSFQAHEEFFYKLSEAGLQNRMAGPSLDLYESKISAEEHLEEIISIIENTDGIAIESASFEYRGLEKIVNKWDQAFPDNKIDYEILKSVGLIDYNVIKHTLPAEQRVDIKYYLITELGYDFWCACVLG